MRKYESDLLQTLHERGYIKQITEPKRLDALASNKIIPAYIGFDATAPSLHVGSLVQIMMLRWLQQTGHKPIILMGGGTTKVGDPSGKDESRKLLSDPEINENIRSIRRVFKRFLRFGTGPTDATIINNAQWLGRLQYISFLREIGRHFTINRMLTFESVKLRLRRHQPLTFLEFNYMILQAFDFLELSRRAECQLQIGGSDQWGNILNGIDLARRVDKKDLFGLTTPLITTADGGKMGKTARGAVWLDSALTGPYDYWQFWRNTADRDVGRFLKLFTELPIADVRKFARLKGSEINQAKIILATEATTMLHGRGAADAAASTSRETFESGGAGEDLPTIQVSGPMTLVDALTGLGFCASRGEARRLIAQSGARVDDEVALCDLTLSPPVKISAGRKRHGLVVPA